MPAPILLIGLLIFSLLFWCMPSTPRQMHLYMAAQSLVASLIFSQDFIFSYLFLILAGQSLALLRLRIALIWYVGIFLITAYGNLYLHTAGPLEPMVRTVVTTAGYIVSGFLSYGLAEARRARARVQQLLGELSESHRQLAEHAAQSQYLGAAAERNRIAIALHSSIGHKLAASIAQLDGASRLVELKPKQAVGMINNARGELFIGLGELRETLEDLSACGDFGPTAGMEAGAGEKRPEDGRGTKARHD